ncbi:hypothetical protein [Aquabacterium sp.]|uniref:hypothetical protein n=1 Tax=Aquabacterium sp. TaxID=1872578 RepID=UPI002C228A66|nr:hypothetical protein [Aquabacterium sp.]HSW06764.1 hypothetical protein [Aquabacterium sp.]
MSSSQRTPYWLAALKHPVNTALSLGLLTVSLGLSLPWGADGLGLGLLALAAVELVGLVIVPSLPPFRAWVDKRDRVNARHARHEQLSQEIASHGGSPHVERYAQMCSRVTSLYRMAGDSSTALTEREVEQLDDLTLDYLRMCLSDAVMRGGAKVDLTSAVSHKLRDVQRRLDAGGLGRDDEQQLRQAKADYEEAIARQSRMEARRSALEASLVSMPVRLEEVYQMVMSSPRAGNLGQMLEESVSKLRLAEEAALDVEHALGPARHDAVPARAQEAAASAQRRAVGQSK